MRHSYHPSSYDDSFCLKPPLLLWITAIYLSRSVILPFAGAVAAFAGVSEDARTLLWDLWNPNALIPSAVATAVVFAMCQRSPSASQAVRRIWARGRMLLATSAALDLVVSLIELARQEHALSDPSDQALWRLLALGIDAYCLTYVLAARRVRDTFSMFPPPLEPATR